MLIKPPSCNGCVIHDISEGFSKTDGKGTNGVMIVGDHIGYSELHDGLPFRPFGDGGSKLEECFRRLGVSREQFLLTNLVKCIPTRGKLQGSWFEKQAVSYCHTTHTDSILDLWGDSIKVVLALGPIAFSWFTGFSGYQKTRESLDDCRGFPIGWQGKQVIASYHPKWIKKGQEHLTPLLEMDIRRALAVASGRDTNYPDHKYYKKPDYNEYPPLEDCWSFYHHVKDNQGLFISYDIETAIKEDVSEEQRSKRDLLTQNSRPILVQFSCRKGMGLAMPFTADYIPIIKAIFLLSNKKGNHNTWLFDNVVLEKYGIVIEGKTHDTMWMFKHFYPFLPRGLQPVASLMGFPFPWKHYFGSKLQWYGCADVDAVQYIIHELPRRMKEVGVWKGYLEHVYEVKPILDYASSVGMPVVEEKRAGLAIELKEEVRLLVKTIHRELPMKLRNITPKRKDKVTGKFDYGYKKEPKIIKELCDKWNAMVPKILEAEKQGRKCKYKDGYHYIYAKSGLQVRKIRVGEKVEERWCKVLPFKASKEQLTKYIKYKQSQCKRKQDKELYRLATVRGKKDKDGQAKTTTNAKSLQEIIEKTGDPLITAVVSIRSLNKMITNDLPNWTPAEDGAVHTQWGFLSPTGQFNSKGPNIQNASKHSDVGKRFRGIIIAPSGRVIIELDYKAFHVAVMGAIANDKDYVRFSQLDPHSIFGTWIHLDKEIPEIVMSWEEEKINEVCKEFKSKYPKIRQEVCKPAVLGNQLGLGAYKLWNQNKKSIKDVEYAEFLQKRLNEKAPKVDRFKQKLLEQVHVQKYLKNNFGRIAQFYSAFSFKWDKQRMIWEKKHGNDTEAIYAQAVQGNAFGMITELGIRNPAKEDLHRKYNFINTIHDSIIIMPWAREKDKAIEEYYRYMTAPCKQLAYEGGEEGLRVNVEVSMGECFRDLKEIKV